MNPFETLLSTPLIQLGATTITVAHALIAAFCVIVGLVSMLILSLANARRERAEVAEESAARAREADARLAEITRAQLEMQGRMGTIAEIFGSRQAELNKAIGERLDGMTSRLGHSITEQTKSTHENLARLQERLAVIDTAQNNIQSLAGQ